MSHSHGVRELRRLHPGQATQELLASQCGDLTLKQGGHLADFFGKKTGGGGRMVWSRRH